MTNHIELLAPWVPTEIPVISLWKGQGPRISPGASSLRWWRGWDLNPRPSGYEPDELPDCSTPQRARYSQLSRVAMSPALRRARPRVICHVTRSPRHWAMRSTITTAPASRVHHEISNDFVDGAASASKMVAMTSTAIRPATIFQNDESINWPS